MYTFIFFMVVQVLIPYNYQYVNNSIFILVILLSQVIYLMYYVKFYMGGKYDNQEENAEISKVVYLKLALDCLNYVWAFSTYNGLLTVVAQP